MVKTILKLIVFFGLIVGVGLREAKSQDIHYTQFSNGAAWLNPALTGVFQGDSRIYAHYRNQWKKVDAYDGTGTIFFDTKLRNLNQSNGFFAVGFKVGYDRAGFSRLTTVNPALTGSYTLRLGPKWLGTFGAELGYLRRAFNTDDLTFGDQYQGDQFDPTTSEIIDDQNFGILDLGAGMNLRYEPGETRTFVNFGLGLFHLNQGEQKFAIGSVAQTDKYAARLSAYIDANLMLSDGLDLVAMLTYQDQSVYNENLAGIGIKFYGNSEKGKTWAITVGGYGRLSNIENSVRDALAPYMRLDYKKVSLGISYDVNISDFADYTNNQGGIEIWAQYRFDKFKKLDDFKTCRIF